MASTRCGCPARSRSAAGFGFTDGLARSRTCRAAASRPPSTSPSRWRAPRSLPASPVPSTATTPEPPPCGESSTTKTTRRSGTRFGRTSSTWAPTTSGPGGCRGWPNGGMADVLVVAARTAERPGFDAFSLFLVEAGTPGSSTGKGLDKLGQRAENVSELFFDDVVVPGENLLGEVGAGLTNLKQRLPRERLSIGYYGLAASEVGHRTPTASAGPMPAAFRRLRLHPRVPHRARLR